MCTPDTDTDTPSDWSWTNMVKPFSRRKLDQGLKLVGFWGLGQLTAFLGILNSQKKNGTPLDGLGRVIKHHIIDYSTLCIPT